MKKNKALRAASALLVLTLLTTSIIGGTFAKYTTSGIGTDSARVAKWGVTVNSTSNAFATEYNTDDTSVSGTIAKSVVTANGTGADGKKLVAPGTSGNLLATSITGTPEVAVKVTTSAELKLEGWSINNGTANEEYCPIVITIDGTAYKMGAALDADNYVYNTINGFKTAVENALKKEISVAPNTDLAANYAHTVTWAWAFADTSAGAYQTDEKDTALGNLTIAPTIEFTYTATVTQID